MDRPAERNASADLWRRTLAQIPSAFGRLVYLSSLRGPGGTYEHHGFAQVFGPATAQTALLRSHEETFQLWLQFTLEEQKADMDLYLSDLISERHEMIEKWLRMGPPLHVLPHTARASERSLFAADQTALIEILRTEHKLRRPDPER